MADHILVTFGSIADAQGHTSQTYATLNQQLADLKARLAPMIATWDGSASETYQAYQRQWDEAQRELNDILNSMSAALGVSNDNYQQTEAANRAAWA